MVGKGIAGLCLLSGCLIAIMSGSGCLTEPYSVGQPDSLFSEFVLVWDLVDQNYACFCESTVDWDQVYSLYRPLAISADNREQLIEIILETMGELQDIQLALTDSAGSRLQSWDPGCFINWDLSVWQSYMNQWGLDPEMDPFGVSVLAPPLDSIGYFYVRTLDETYSWYTFFLESSSVQQCSCLIIDLRMCSGSGIEINAFYTMGRFTEAGALGYYKSYRTGPGRCDMGELQGVNALKNGSWQFTGPTVLLVGRDTNGAAELLTMLLTTQDHVTIIGDSTGGFANVAETYNLIEDWDVIIPDFVAYTPDSIAVLRHGLAPDIQIEVTEADFQAGVDPVLDAALEMLR